ncbi:ribosome small subunit-dependent GTPase A [Cellulomonas massiliensis]|uniref:ribosome small subunit-dependent GTPase A n=1 Tax=Cellulomonas massiliensis TaxID=1465811 RepID=UPI00058E9388|nr:ribosome small subunit-dependent GTPase A [Cellulomonas massiliensis]
MDGPVLRVVRADRGAVLVVPDDALLQGDPHPGTRAGAGSAPDGDAHRREVRALLDRDGAAPSDDPAAEGGRLVPTVGDRVRVERTADPGAAPRVVEVLPRRTALVRDSAGGTSRTQALAANVDVVLVVEHLDPDPDLGRLERMLTLAWRSGAQPVVVLTKADLVPDPDGMAAEVAAVALAVPVHAVSASRDEGLDAVRALLAPGVTLVVVGPSGAGKSTLVNALAGRDVMAVGARREGDGRGRHTTTHRELVPLAGGAMLVDTPGIRTVGLVADDDALDATFADVRTLAEACRFADCSHASEPGCAVRAALESGELPQRRYDSWLKLGREAAFQARRADVRLAAEERRRWKHVHREARSRARHRPGR